MQKKLFILLTVFLLVVSNFSNLTYIAAIENAQAEESGSYEIYPLPQKEEYLGESFTITNQVNLVIESTIDESTENFVKKILASKSITFTESNETVSNKTNIIIGTKGSGEYVDSYFSSDIDYNASLYHEIDAYILRADKNLEENGTIAILGDTTDASYYGLATLQMIFNQMPGKEIESVMFEDYADSKWRGFIEGFYGFPWSHEDRISLMRYGGQFKMNSYIFAPKDDPYHNRKWRTLYPEDELAKVKELVDVGHESKTQFIWAIHPGFSMIDWDDYDNELDTLLTKLEQLYDVGVRQFGLFLDDISLNQALNDTDEHVQLITDVADWVDSKGDVKSLVYCPPFYNQAWTGESGKPYLQALRNVPDNVEVMWTGRDVIGGVNTEDNQWVKDIIGRDPYIWFNWPVNGYKKNRLLLGKVGMLEPNTHNFSGIVSNPLEQAELSKVALFGVADYTWNVDEFNDEQSWLDSFKYIQPEVADEFRTIAHHLSDPSPNSRGVTVGESENIKEELNLFLDNFSKSKSIDTVGTQLIDEFDKILNAISVFKEKNKNENMVEEITPWLNSLDYVVQADKHAINAAFALEKGDISAAWESLSKASSAMAESKKFTRPVINAEDQIVESGAKRLVPFANELIRKLDSEIYKSINSDVIVPVPMTSYGSHPDINNMIDGDKDTLVYFKTLQENGDWYGVDLGNKVTVNSIEIIQGRNDEDHDIFQRGMLEYSNDGEDWNSITEEKSGYHIKENNLDIEARYVRYKLTHAGIPGGKPDLWTSVREFTVNGDQNKPSIYTNVIDLQEEEINKTNSSIEITNVDDITLEPSDYIGIKLPAIERIEDIGLESSSNDGVVIETSENGVEWEEISLESPYPNAAYIRVINKNDTPVSFNLNKLSVKPSIVEAPSASHNYGGTYAGDIENVYDGELESKVWFNSAQSKGKYVQIDLGRVINVKHAAVAINDGENDYFRQGELQLSMDGEEWKTIHTFSNPNDRDQNFPDHEAPYRYLRTEVDSIDARYVRLISTEENSKWLALNEIIINNGINGSENESLELQVEPKGKNDNSANYVIDKKLSTFYMPEDKADSGYLNYKLTTKTDLEQLIILQNPTGISNATVSIRDLDGWKHAGKLSKSFNVIDTSDFDHVLEVRLEWDEPVVPKIHEILAVSDDGIDKVVDTTELEQLIVEANGYSNEDGTYTTPSFQALQDAIVAAEASLETIESEEDLNTAVNNLQAAIEGLKQVEKPEPEVETKELKDLIKTAKDYSLEDYTEASYQALQDAIATAEIALTTIKSEEELANSIEALQHAINGLEEADEQPSEGDPTDKPSDDEDGADDGEQSQENEDSELPDTATSTYNLLMIGFILIVMGAAVSISIRTRYMK
ncbi:Hyaluronoglucosaminidase precursor [Paraliobacillus sp. PM-2]|uniref:beta-N-acetylglucosaminidase domain-containing protein n=1 Tax=Paraliobacillus sp. PM-2 TaxID=1462524 RepID=UPI00061BC251|nr:beta-N-acetylglucosaminidase domain-containing protein [Paraliobacillus sp. PM-2]CQR47248.1 Hyaluronoglucosaminidase precursor [Paraliobacillus sp. PM-2]